MKRLVIGLVLVVGLGNAGVGRTAEIDCTKLEANLAELQSATYSVSSFMFRAALMAEEGGNTRLWDKVLWRLANPAEWVPMNVLTGLNSLSGEQAKARAAVLRVAGCPSSAASKAAP